MLFDISAAREVRVQRLVREYGSADRNEFAAAMQRITRKLGGQSYKAAKEKLEEGDMPSTIDILLTYYDKAYGLGLKNKEHRVKGRVSWNGKDVHSCADQLIQLAK